MSKYFYVLLTITLTVYGQITIKQRAMHHAPSYEGSQFIVAMFLDPWVWTGLISALAASATWMLAVRSAELSLVYPIMALTFILVPVLAVIFFGEKLNAVQVVGLVLIVVGVALSAFYR